MTKSERLFLADKIADAVGCVDLPGFVAILVTTEQREALVQWLRSDEPSEVS